MSDFVLTGVRWKLLASKEISSSAQSSSAVRIPESISFYCQHCRKLNSSENFGRMAAGGGVLLTCSVCKKLEQFSTADLEKFDPS